MAIVTLTTDFGIQDAYVGAMKGTILEIAPGTALVDLSHQVAPQDVAGGAFVLSSAYSFFPAGTIHLAVVDPGVGTARRGIVVETRAGWFVGPDNGLFSPILAAEPGARVVELRNPDLMRPEVSATFHGRDVFAPAAAHLCRGVPADRFGPPVSDPVRLDLWSVVRENGGLRGHVVHVDRFGNCVTNLPRQAIEQGALGRPARVLAGGRLFERICRTYGDVDEGVALVLYGSRNTVEVSVNGGSAAQALGIRRGAEVRVRWEPEA